MGSEMCIRDRSSALLGHKAPTECIIIKTSPSSSGEGRGEEGIVILNSMCFQDPTLSGLCFVVTKISYSKIQIP